MRNWPHRKLKGRTEIREIEFTSLKANPLRDPFKRTVVAYLPPHYDRQKKQLPFIVALSGFFGTSSGFLNTDPVAYNIVEQADSLIENGLAPFILVCVDGFTRYGGSQYLNSSATGNYESMIVKDLIPWIHKEYRVSAPCGIMGKSSGGYGALMLSMQHPEIFQTVACHSGDMYFELCYKPEFPLAADAIQSHGSSQKFLGSFVKKEKPSSSDFAALNMIAMASCYSPNPKEALGFDLPFEPETAELQENIWKKWLSHDPVHLVQHYAKNLKKLKLLFLDCGNKDEYFLHFGARIFSKKLKRLHIPHVYQEFPDTHRGTAYRYSTSLPLIAKSLTA